MSHRTRKRLPSSKAKLNSSRPPARQPPAIAPHPWRNLVSDSQLSDTDPTENDSQDGPWYAGVTRYQWLVLAIASAGWVFDVYEGQIFNITRGDMLTEILGGEGADVQKYGDLFLGIFLLGDIDDNQDRSPIRKPRDKLQARHPGFFEIKNYRALVLAPHAGLP